MKKVLVKILSTNYKTPKYHGRFCISKVCTVFTQIYGFEIYEERENTCNALFIPSMAEGVQYAECVYRANTLL